MVLVLLGHRFPSSSLTLARGSSPARQGRLSCGMENRADQPMVSVENFGSAHAWVSSSRGSAQASSLANWHLLLLLGGGVNWPPPLPSD